MNTIDQTNVIDMQEKVLTKEDLEKDYVDIKQAAQIFNNVSEKTAAKYIKKASESNSTKTHIVTVTANGGVKNLYKKEDIITIAKALSKDKGSIYHVPVEVTETINENNDVTEWASNSVPTPSKTFQGSSDSQEQQPGQQLTTMRALEGVVEIRTGIKEISTNLRDLDNSIRNVNQTMQTTMTELFKQGVDIKERYFLDREKRTEIEKIQAESAARQAETLAQLVKQGEDLKAILATKNANEKPSTEEPQQTKTLQMWIPIVSAIAIVLVGGAVVLTESSATQKRQEKQFEDRLALERQAQQAQRQQMEDMFKTYKEELLKVIPVVNATTNASK